MIAHGGYHFRSLGIDGAMPDAWRALDRAVARWVVIHGGSLLLAQVAGWASLAEGHGDSALPLNGPEAGRHGMPALDDVQRAALSADCMVSVSGGPADVGDTPFVIDHEHFYLRRNFLYEVAVAGHIHARRTSPLPAGEATTTQLDALFHGERDDRVQPQRDAVAGVLGRRLFVLTGGPGTGKTTTVLRMLLMLARDRADRGEAVPVIRIGAPTGKAAQRLSESLRDGAARLRGHTVSPLPTEWLPHLESALTAEAGTLHRLLGSRGSQGGFRYHAGNPLPAEIVIVDEASMIDLAMLRMLLDALKHDTVLILVGDADQLTSVGTGSVLLDLVGALEAQAAPELVRLHHSFRADTALVPINQAILDGDAAAFANACQRAGARAVRHALATAQDLRHRLDAWCRQLRQQLEQCGACAAIPTGRSDLVWQALDGLRERQLLCALREGEFGAEQVNAVIERTLGGWFGGHAGAAWYPGQAVMITRNDYTAGLFNGDVGLCLRDEEGNLGVWFETAAQHAATSDDDSRGVAASRGVVCFTPANLPDHQGAFAVTIHKSQGSEYGHVAVLLPPDAENRILSRQLLYTAVSRARQAVEIWGTDEVIARAIATPVRRAGGLARRLSVSTLA